MSSSQCLLRVLRPVYVPSLNGVQSANTRVLVPSRGLHQKEPNWKSGKNEDFVKPFKKKYVNESAQGDVGGRKRKFGDKEPDEKKIEMKEWTEQSPTWLNRDHNESELTKHIEVLQRFADRYTALSNESAGKSKLDEKEDSRKRLLKVLDKQHNKKYSTFVRAQGRKKKEPATNRIGKTGSSRTFITLANEPRRLERIGPKAKPIVPVVQNFRNPDSVLLQSMVTQTVKPKLYSVVNPKFKNKEFEAYVKKIILGQPKKDKTKEKKQEATIGEYFTGRYTKKTQKDTSESKSSEELSTNIQKRLVENRRRVLAVPTTKSEPTIHPKTSLLVQPSHLPITLCKNMKKKTVPDKSELVPSASKKSPSPVVTKSEQDRASSRAASQPSLLNRLMTYFKR